MKNFGEIVFFLAIIFITAGCKNSSDILITLSPEMCEKPGRFIPDGELPTPRDLALDTYCAEQILKKRAPKGVVTIFGSARTGAGDRYYEDTRKFAYLWTKEMGKDYPILTGGGPGIMEAGNRGAKEAGGRNIGFTTYFHGGTEKPNHYMTDVYIFADFSRREAELVNRAAAIVTAPGGYGTEWEIYESLSKAQTGKIKKIPIILLGGKKVWDTLVNRIYYLKKLGTISPEDLGLYNVVETPEEAVKIIKQYLKSGK